VARTSHAPRSFVLLTEQEVSRSWSQIFKGGKFETATFDRAEEMLDELRPESPLRHRLTLELEELRDLYASKQSVGA
jgi:xanthine/CO dehydrogenase XdhC/CoxF family maturation factor